MKRYPLIVIWWWILTKHSWSLTLLTILLVNIRSLTRWRWSHIIIVTACCRHLLSVKSEILLCCLLEAVRHSHRIRSWVRVGSGWWSHTASGIYSWQSWWILIHHLRAILSISCVHPARWSPHIHKRTWIRLLLRRRPLIHFWLTSWWIWCAIYLFKWWRQIIIILITSWVHCLCEICIPMPVVQAAISDVCPCMKLIYLWWLILTRLISSVIEYHPVCAVNKLEPFSFLIWFGWLKRLSLTTDILLRATICSSPLHFFLTRIIIWHDSCIACFSTIFTYQTNLITSRSYNSQRWLHHPKRAEKKLSCSRGTWTFCF